VHGSAVPASYLVTQFEGKRLCAGRSQWSLGKRIADRTVTRETPSPINIVEMTSAGSSPLSLARQCGLYGVISVHVCSKKFLTTTIWANARLALGRAIVDVCIELLGVACCGSNIAIIRSPFIEAY
jgi:hypothetical protein